MMRVSGTREIRLRTIGPLLLVLASIAAGAQESRVTQNASRLTPDVKDALARISPDSLRGHLSFIASDSLQGRDTPSQGLDLAAEYIAAQFRRAGLEPAGDDAYYQSSRWTVIRPNPERFRLTLNLPEGSLEIPASRFFMKGYGALDLDSVRLVKIPYGEESLGRYGAMNGKAILTSLPGDPLSAVTTSNRRAFLDRVAKLEPSAILVIERDGPGRDYFNSKSLTHPEFTGPSTDLSRPLTLSIYDPSAAAAFDAMPSESSEASFSVHAGPPLKEEVVLRNVAGVLRGSDPVLKDTYIMLSAHYDHIGMRPRAEGDKIWNGANDDGSGTVSVIEIASALAGLPARPRRSLLFIAFFGEERGLLGSRYYGRHPLFPVERTVAAVNLEQVGRTDSSEGDQRGKASLTGFDYSDIGKVFEFAGEQTGIRVYKHERNSDDYFSRSDNLSLANLGIPSHTLCVAFDFPDYHGPADHWDKIDYDNMARTDRMVALSLVMLAEGDQPPRWNPSNPRAARYLQAWEERHPR